MPDTTTYGTNGDDVLSGGNGKDTIYGLDGDDIISGGNGIDNLFGDAGDDQLTGDNGADNLTGGADDDILDGLNGFDTAYYSGPIGEYSFFSAAGYLHILHLGGAGADGHDQVTNVERLVFADRVIDIGSGSNAPVAVDDHVSIDEDTGTYSSGTASVKDNDFDFDGDPLTVTGGVFVGTYGTLTLNADGTYSYTLTANLQGMDDGETVTDSFNYTVTDNDGSDTGALVFHIAGLNDAPVANDDTNSTTEDAPASGNVLGNDTDVDVEPLTVANPGTYFGVYGTLVLAVDGSYTYTPNAAAQALDDGEVVNDAFGYTATDGTASDTAMLTIDVTGLNDAPVANDDTASTTEDAAVSGNVLANDTDVDVEPLTVTTPGTYAGAYGSLTLAADGSYTYTPNAAADGLAAGESAQDVFGYTASDGTASDTATLTVTVNGTNDSPTIDAGGTDATGSATELPNNDVNENAFTHTDSGTVAFDDLDLSDVHSASFTPQGGGYLGTFTLDPVNQPGDTVGWDFSVEDSDLDFLDAGDTLTQTYTVEIDDGNGGTVNQDVTITLTGAADAIPPDGTNWYIDNSAVGSAETGSPSDPFTSIAAFNAAQGTVGGPGTGDNVFLLAGTGTYAEADGINLLDGQVLTGVAAGPLRPTIEASAGDGVNVAQNNTVSGLDVGNTSGADIADGGGSVGTLTVTDVGSSGTGQIVDIDQGGTLNVTLNSAESLGSSGGAIDLDGVGGSFTVSGATTITGVHTGGGIDITGSSVAATFNAGLVIANTAGAGLNATGGGTLTITGAGNSVTTTTGTAVTISGTTIGAGGVTLDSVSSSGAASGIVLANTGAGAFSVTGTGTAGSGGAILASTGAGVSLTNTGGLVSLTDIAVSNGAADGILGSGVDGLALIRATVANNGDASGEHGVDLTGLTGISTVTDSFFTGNASDNFHLVNSAGTLDLTVTGSTFGNSLGANANDGLFIQANGTALMRVSVTGSTFTDNRGDHFQFTTDLAATSTSHITFNDNDLSSTSPAVLGGGITVNPVGPSDLFLAIENNDIQNAFGSAVVVNLSSSTAASELHATITGNTIGTAGDADSGSVSGNGIDLQFAGAGTMTALVDGNDVHGWGGSFGISALARGSGRLNATITDNVLDTPGAFATNAIRVVAGAVSADTAQIYLELSGNDSATALAQDIFVRTRFGADILMPGYGGAPADAVAADAFITADNPLGGDVVIAANALAGSGFFDTPGSLPVPLSIYPDAPFV